MELKINNYDVFVYNNNKPILTEFEKAQIELTYIEKQYKSDTIGTIIDIEV